MTLFLEPEREGWEALGGACLRKRRLSGCPNEAHVLDRDLLIGLQAEGPDSRCP